MELHEPRTAKETRDLLEELRKAADEHRHLIERQIALISRLQADMKDVKR